MAKSPCPKCGHKWDPKNPKKGPYCRCELINEGDPPRRKGIFKGWKK